MRSSHVVEYVLVSVEEHGCSQGGRRHGDIAGHAVLLRKHGWRRGAERPAEEAERGLARGA